MDVSDIVRIDGNMKEAGKTPSRSVMLHRYIYEKQAHINAVLIAHPPSIMSFAVTDTPFDSKIIPESYIMLRDILKLPFGCSFMQPELTAGEFSKSVPIALIENDCIVVTGDSLINAFDRLEVAEYSAKGIISAKSIGDIVMIDNNKIKEIEKAYNLE